MRTHMYGLLLAVGFGAASGSGVMAATSGTDLRGAIGSYPVVEQIQYGYGGYRRHAYCDRLRRACMHKDERGETGLGNCRRYREECRGR